MHDRPDTIHEHTLSDLDRVQARLLELESELEERRHLSTLGMVSAVLAHEFNNLLTPILGYSTLALRRPEDRELSGRALRATAEAAGRATTLARSILALCGHESEDAQTKAGTDPLDVFGSVRACIELHTESGGVQVEVEGESVHVAMTPAAMQQVLLNLSLNAISAITHSTCPRSNDSTGVLRMAVYRNICSVPNLIRSRTEGLSASEQRAGDDESEAWTWVGREDANHGIERPVFVVIGDSGVGMARSGGSFEPFLGEHHNFLRAYPRGSGGLGLKIVRTLTERVGGVIGVRSARGVGTQIAVVLPEYTGDSSVRAVA